MRCVDRAEPIDEAAAAHHDRRGGDHLADESPQGRGPSASAEQAAAELDHPATAGRFTPRADRPMLPGDRHGRPPQAIRASAWAGADRDTANPRRAGREIRSTVQPIRATAI